MKRNVELYEYKGKFTYGLEIEDVPNDVAEKLNKEFKVNAQHARYHVDGSWYSQMYDFPCVLFDRFGYIVFKTEREYLSHGVKNMENSETHLQVDKGIHTLSGYILYPHTPLTFINIKLELHKAEKRRIFIKEQETQKLKHTESLREIMLKSLKGASPLLKA